MNVLPRLAPLALALLLGCATPGPDPLAAPLPDTDDAVNLYAAGRAMLTRFPQLFVMEMSDEDRRTVLAGVSDAMTQTPTRLPLPEQAELHGFLLRRMRETADLEEKANAPFLEAAAAAEGAEVLDSGVIVRVLDAGEGDPPTEVDAVRVRFQGTLRDGTRFTGVRPEDPPKVYLVRSLLPCWTEVISKLAPGGRLHVVCPPQLAFGDEGQPPFVRPGAALGFEIELVDVILRE